MPWYVLEAHHGPGHQSGHRTGKRYDSSDFHYAPERIKRADRREWFEYLTRELQNPVGNLRLVRTLPKKVREEKIQEYRDRVKSARQMLKELSRM